MTANWSPQIGEYVVIPMSLDFDPDDVHVVVGYVADDGQHPHRAGQPLLERLSDGEGLFGSVQKKGDRSCAHPMFVRPLWWVVEQSERVRAESGGTYVLKDCEKVRAMYPEYFARIRADADIVEWMEHMHG